jgi:hypothetical protein
MAPQASSRRRIRRTLIAPALVSAFLLATATVVNAGLAAGTLPGAGFTYTGTALNTVNMAGDAVRLKVKDDVTIKTTYSIVTPADQILGGWHYHNGPVIVTVTVGTLTFYDASCGTWDVSAGESYIETTGQVLNARAVVSKNPGGSLQWFTTRLIPGGAADPVAVAAPCNP